MGETPFSPYIPFPHSISEMFHSTLQDNKILQLRNTAKCRTVTPIMCPEKAWNCHKQKVFQSAITTT